jgi:hypothetical protein
MQFMNRRTNRFGERKHFDLAQPRFGVDIQIKINPDNPYGYYDVDLVDRTKLTAEELAYSLLSLDVRPETLSEARREWQKLKSLYAGEQPLKTEGPILNWEGWGLR